jgi:hypothetical protein
VFINVKGASRRTSHSRHQASSLSNFPSLSYPAMSSPFAKTVKFCKALKLKAKRTLCRRGATEPEPLDSLSAQTPPSPHHRNQPTALTSLVQAEHSPLPTYDQNPSCPPVLVAEGEYYSLYLSLFIWRSMSMVTVALLSFVTVRQSLSLRRQVVALSCSAPLPRTSLRRSSISIEHHHCQWHLCRHRQHRRKGSLFSWTASIVAQVGPEHGEVDFLLSTEAVDLPPSLPRSASNDASFCQ